MVTAHLTRHGWWVPLLAGFIWMAAATDESWVGFVFGGLPGAMLLAAGAAAALWPGDPRPLQVGSMAALLGCALGVPAFFWAGVLDGLALIVLAAASFVALGALSLGSDVSTHDIGEAERSVGLAAAVAVDEALLGVIVPLALRRRNYALLREGQAALRFFSDHGWDEKPADYHRTPPPLEHVQIRARSVRGMRFEQLSFESGFDPHPGEPGGERWLTYPTSRTAHAWLLRHESPERPWLICIHGILMGRPEVDFTAFRAQRLHRELGLNVLLPLLPFHGPRAHGRISGNGFLSEQILDTVHAFAQGCWDVRRIISWIRRQGGTTIGIHGLSLGGYVTALIASLESELACAIPGVPAVDFAGLTWRHAPPYELARFEREGLDREAFKAVLAPVSPLALTPRVTPERRYIFGGLADRIAPPEQVRALWEHWGQPRIQWYNGSHVNFLLYPSVRRFIDQALRESLLAE